MHMWLWMKIVVNSLKECNLYSFFPCCELMTTLLPLLCCYFFITNLSISTVLSGWLNTKYNWMWTRQMFRLLFKGQAGTKDGSVFFKQAKHNVNGTARDNCQLWKHYKHLLAEAAPVKLAEGNTAAEAWNVCLFLWILKPLWWIQH